MNQATFDLIAAWINVLFSLTFLVTGEPVTAAIFLGVAILWRLMMIRDERKN